MIVNWIAVGASFWHRLLMILFIKEGRPHAIIILLGLAEVYGGDPEFN
jgi:hypothetical protein